VMAWMHKVMAQGGGLGGWLDRLGKKRRVGKRKCGYETLWESELRSRLNAIR
jgi:hypothetical protein